MVESVGNILERANGVNEVNGVGGLGGIEETGDIINTSNLRPYSETIIHTNELEKNIIHTNESKKNIIFTN